MTYDHERHEAEQNRRLYAEVQARHEEREKNNVPNPPPSLTVPHLGTVSEQLKSLGWQRINMGYGHRRAEWMASDAQYHGAGYYD